MRLGTLASFAPHKPSRKACLGSHPPRGWPFERLTYCLCGRLVDGQVFSPGWIRDPGLGQALHLLITQLADFYHTDGVRPVVLFPSKLESKGGVVEIPNFEAGSNWHLDPGGGRGSICGSVFTLARITGLQQLQPSVLVLITPFCISPTELAEQGPGDIPHQLTFVLAVSNTSIIRCPVAQDINVGAWGWGESSPGQLTALTLSIAFCQLFAKRYLKGRMVPL